MTAEQINQAIAQVKSSGYVALKGCGLNFRNNTFAIVKNGSLKLKTENEPELRRYLSGVRAK